MEQNKEKPSSIIIDELRFNIINMLSSSRIAPCILEPILKTIYDDVANAARIQLEQDKKQYQEYLSNQEKEQEVIE